MLRKSGVPVTATAKETVAPPAMARPARDGCGHAPCCGIFDAAQTLPWCQWPLVAGGEGRDTVDEWL